jgi:glutathione S-transferase
MISTFISGWVPTLLRAGRGMIRYRAAQTEAPEQQLTLWDYDGNQFSRLVREALCELELPYKRIACGKGSKRRSELKALSGQTTCPYLIDPNTGTSIQDSQQAVSYLFATYGNATQVPS